MATQATHPLLDGMDWLTSYAEIEEVLKSADFAQAAKSESIEFLGDTLLTLEGERHASRRRLLGRLITRQSLAEYEREVLAPTVDGALHGLRERRGPDGTVRADLVGTVRGIFLSLAASIIGLDDRGADAEAELLRELYLLIDASTVEWATTAHEPVIEQGREARQAFVERFIRPSWERRLALVSDVAAGRLAEDALRTDVLTIMALHGDQFTLEQVIRECVLFLVASTLNNTALVTNFVDEIGRWSGEHPEDADRILEVDFFRGALDEVLRLHPPTPALLRQAVRSTQLSTGRSVEAGEYLALDLVRGNRDPDVFGADAERFDPRRSGRLRGRAYGLSFGAGVHFCLGQPFVAVATGDAGTTGSHYRIIRSLYEAGMVADGGGVMAANVQPRYDVFPVRFENL